MSSIRYLCVSLAYVCRQQQYLYFNSILQYENWIRNYDAAAADRMAA